MPDQPQPLWTVAEVASFLGCSNRHVYKMVAEKRIPFSRVAGLRFRPSAIEAWVASRQIEAVR